MHRLWRYDVFRFAKNDVAPLRVAMTRCLPLCAVRHTSFVKRTSLGEAHIICRRQTSLKKRTFVLVDKSAFFVGRGSRDRTHGTRFWRPLLYLLSYTPVFVSAGIYYTTKNLLLQGVNVKFFLHIPLKKSAVPFGAGLLLRKGHPWNVTFFEIRRICNKYASIIW